MDMRLRNILDFSIAPQSSSNPKIPKVSADRCKGKVGAVLFNGGPIEISR
jgi:hypothetical protein